MIRFVFLAALLLLGSLPAVTAGPAPAVTDKNPGCFVEFSPEDQTKLRAGETVVWSHSMRDREPKKIAVLSAILLPATLQEVWSFIDDKEGACEYISDLERCKVIARNGSEDLVEQTTRPQGAPRSFTYTLRHQDTFPTRMDFHRESGDLRDIVGSWVFDPVDDGSTTLLIYALHIDAGILVPQRLIRHSQEKQLPDVLLAIRTRMAYQKQIAEKASGTVPAACPALPPAPAVTATPTATPAPNLVAAPEVPTVAQPTP